MALGAAAPRTLAGFAELLAHVRVPLWRGPTEGRVRILSPYRLRATRVSHLFVAGLADGSFPAASGGDPLLSDERRRALGLPRRTDPAAEERYLFYTCVAKPERCLHLSYPASDEAGGEAPRSPFVDEVRDLLDPPPTPRRPATTRSKPVSSSGRRSPTSFPAPEDASAPHDLARALAAPRRRRGRARPRPSSCPTGPAERARRRGRGVAPSALLAAREPGPLRDPDVLAELGGRDLFGASTLEEYLGCSYRWFVGRELRPQRIEPDPEALETGGIVHETLERLFRERPGGEPAADGRRRCAAGSRGRRSSSARSRPSAAGTSSRRRASISLARLDAVLDRFLRRDAATGGPLMPDPDLLEARFGDGPERSVRARRPRDVPAPRRDRPDRRRRRAGADPRLQAQREGGRRGATSRRRGGCSSRSTCWRPADSASTRSAASTTRSPRRRTTARAGCSTRSTAAR